MLDELIATRSPAHIVRATVRTAARAYEERLGLDHVPDRQLPTYGEAGIVVLAARYEDRIHRLVRNYQRSAEYADLYQAALMALVETLREYDPDGSAEPMTVAYRRIQNAVRETAAASSPFLISTSAHHRYWRAMEACDHDPVLAREWAYREGLTGRELQDMADSGDDMAAAILDRRIERWEREGLDVAQQLDVKTARGLSRTQFDAIHEAIHYVSVDDAPVAEPCGENATQTIGDMVECHRSAAALASVETRDLVHRLLDHVSPREREALVHLTGLGGPELSVAETAHIMGVDPGRVRSLKATALRKLRRAVAEMAAA